MLAKSKPHVTIEAVVIKADGTKIDLGVISDNKRSVKKNG